MAEMGKLLSMKETADILYSADYEKGIVDIADLGKDASIFFVNIEVGTEVTLQRSDGSKLNLLITSLNVGQHIQCEAVIQK